VRLNLSKSGIGGSVGRAGLRLGADVKRRKYRLAGEFERCPSRVPAVDKRRRCARIALKTMPVHGFDRWANWPAKVRNVSRLGSQFAFSKLSPILLIPLRVFDEILFARTRLSVTPEKTRTRSDEFIKFQSHASSMGSSGNVA
jgi:hypothetical protein